MDGKVLLLVVAGLLGAVFFLSGKSLEIPETVAMSGGGVVSLSGNKKVTGDKSDPNSFVRTKFTLGTALGAVAATEHLTAAFAGKVLADPAETDDLIPGKLTGIKAEVSCRIAKPKSGSRVVNVRSIASGATAGIYLFSDEHVQAKTKEVLRTFRKLGRPKMYYPRDVKMKLSHVAVSDTDYPVHLVLQSRDTVLWAIHKKPDSKITGITIVGSDQTGIAGVPDGVDVSFVPASVLAKCNVSQQIQPVVNPVMLSSIENGFISQEDADETLGRIKDAKDRFNTWFTGRFGVNSDETIIGYKKGWMALAGPLPTNEEELVPYTQISGSEILLLSDRYRYSGDRKGFRELFKGQVMELANEISGGDLANVVVREES